MTAPHARVSEPWVISGPDDQGDRWVHAKDEVTEMLTSNDDLRSFLRTKCRNNIARPAIGNKKFWIRSSHELYERDPYDPRLIKTIIIKVFGTVNKDIYTRYGEGKGPFI